ncbi:MAG: hypothetical protein ACT4QC_08510 [Planctomycetaceae bacterium]
MKRIPPAHWSPRSGPNNWYTVWHPPTWKAEDNAGVLGLRAAEKGGQLTLTSFWLESASSAAVGQVLDLDRLFPRRRRVRRLQTPDLGPHCVGFEGEARIDEPAPWWRRLLRRGPWVHWRVWCVQQQSVCVLALYLQSERRDREAETVAAMIVGSIDFQERPACPPEVFSQRVLELARSKFPLLDCQPAADFQLKVGESKLNLFNFYRSYVNAPERFESIVLPALTTVVQVQEWGREQTDPPLDVVRERIMPMLYPEEVWRERFPSFVGAPWVGGLVVLYVVDESHAYWYIRDDLLKSWQMTADDLHVLAVANLERYFSERPLELAVAGDETGPRLVIPARPDAYNTSWLLSENYHRKLRPVLGSEFVVGTPGRDFFVAVSLDSPEAIEHVRQRVGHDFEQMDHPLSERLLLVTHDGVTEYVPWGAGNPSSQITDTGDTPEGEPEDGGV